MKKGFSILQRVGRAFMLPIAVLPMAGILLGVGGAFTSKAVIDTYHLTFLEPGTVLNKILVLFSNSGSFVFANLSVIFAVGVAIGLANQNKETAALSGLLGFLLFHTVIGTVLGFMGYTADTTTVQAFMDVGFSYDVAVGKAALYTKELGIFTLQTGVLGGIICGCVSAMITNKFSNKTLPDYLAFFSGNRLVPVLTMVFFIPLGVIVPFIWPAIFAGVVKAGAAFTAMGPIGTFLYGFTARLLNVFGLHHAVYPLFWYTELGGTMEVAGQLVAGGQRIFFAQLADSANIAHFSADATRYFSGEFIFMIFGLPGAALAMYHCAKPEKKKAAGGLLLSAALACMATGITEPLEFSFLFVAPALFVVQVILAGTAYMIAHILNIAVGLTFSGGLLDFFLFGILQGNEKTSWMRVIPVGILYFFLYYFIFKFMIKKFDFKTPGREDDDVETKLYTKADVKARKEAQNDGVASEDAMSEAITKGLGGKKNISDVDCCATRLRCTVHDAARVSDGILKATGASGVVHKGNGVQVIYGPNVTVIKSNLEDYLEKAPNTYAEAENTPTQKEAEPTQETKEQKVVDTITVCSPISGLAADLSTAPDEAFAEKMMGDGAVVTPEDAIVRAPEDGEVCFVFDTKHAIGFMTESGVSLLIHVGIDTVKLDGKGFECFVENGQAVKKGDPMLKLDLDYLRENAPSVASPVLCTELEDNQKIRLLNEGEIKAGDELFAIDIYEA